MNNSSFAKNLSQIGDGTFHWKAVISDEANSSWIGGSEVGESSRPRHVDLFFVPSRQVVPRARGARYTPRRAVPYLSQHEFSWSALAARLQGAPRSHSRDTAAGCHADVTSTSLRSHFEFTFYFDFTFISI